MDLIGNDPDWFVDAECRGVQADVFFPERGESMAPAKEICSHCLVQVECLEYALAESIRFGIWGGLSERERRRDDGRGVVS